MYEELDWRDNWLWIKSTPNGYWVRATTERTIEYLLAEIDTLRALYRANHLLLQDNAALKRRLEEIQMIAVGDD